ncbi:MAG TPA: NUDIX domain-containing protein [Prolixibacteraceae bacterium]
MVINTHPRDVLKFCPRCGCKAFKTNDNGRSFNCEACRFNYFINNSAAVACLIFNTEGKLLLARRAIEPAKGMLDLPGGFVEPMESAEAAVVREIKEELGVLVTEAKFLASFPNEYIFSDFSVFTVDLAFVCKVDDIAAIVPADDVSEIEFVSPKDVKKEDLCSDSMANIIGQYIIEYQC